MNDLHLPELMTIAEFRRRFSISNTQVYREVAAGRLRLRKMGVASRISRLDAEAWASALPKWGSAPSEQA